MAGQKAILLRATLQRGPGEFLRQGWRSLRDTFWSQRHFLYRFLYRITAEEVLAQPDANSSGGVVFRAIRDWSELSPATRTRLEGASFGWGRREWLDEGWGMWVGEREGALACVGWWRTPAQSDYFVPLAADEELLWQTAVPPEFRGQRILDAALLSLMQERARNGVRAFHGSCRDCNTTSRRMFARMGWTWLGFAEIGKRGPAAGRAVWHPASRPIPARAMEGST